MNLLFSCAVSFALILCINISAVLASQNLSFYDLEQLFKIAAQNENPSDYNSRMANPILPSTSAQRGNSSIFQQISDFLGLNQTAVQELLDNFSNATDRLTDTFTEYVNSTEFQQALSVGGTALDAYLQNFLEAYGVRPPCYKDMKIVATALANNDSWALRMLDSFGKPRSALMNGQTRWLGSYDECTGIRPENSYQVDGGLVAIPQDFSAKYCSIRVDLGQGSLPIQATLEEGTCWPESCSAGDIKGLIIAVITAVTRNKTEGPKVHCQEVESLDTSAIIAICILSVLGILIILGTLYDALGVQMKRHSNDDKEINYKNTTTDGISNAAFVPQLETNKNAIEQGADLVHVDWKVAAGADNDTVAEVKIDDPQPTTGSLGTAEKVLLSFSVYTNGVKILSTQQSAGSLGAVNGVRFLSMAWVILGHTYYFAVPFGENTSVFFGAQQFYWPFMGILYANVSVDSFFALSGLLVAYLTLRELKKAGGVGRFNWFMFFFHRFWRLTPVYMLVIMVFATLVKYIGSGPLWNSIGGIYDNCKENWWTNLLYVNNFVHTDRLCVAWTWYLANDMQFYILSPLILIPLFYQVIVGGLVSLLFLAGTVTTTALIIMNHHYPGQSVAGAPAPDDKDSEKNVYFPCYTRMGPYIIGLITGYLLYKTKCKCKMPKVLVLLGWLICFGVCILVVYGPYTDKDLGHIFSDVESIIYRSLNRTCWGIAVCWIIFACATGNGGWINELLSWKAFIPLGRLTYCAYLVHPIVTSYYYMSRRHLVYYNNVEVSLQSFCNVYADIPRVIPLVTIFFIIQPEIYIYLFIGNIVMSYGVAFLVSLAFESPMMGLEKAILRRNRRS